MFTISLEVKKKYFKSVWTPPKEFHQASVLAEVEVSDDLLQEVEKEEERVLVVSMFHYLARKETSPQKLFDWLYKRRLSESLVDALITIAKDEKYLDVKRYIEYAVEKAFIKGKQPWWIFSKELEGLCLLGGESDEEKEVVRESIESRAYNDLDMLIVNKALGKEYLQFKAQDSLVKFKNKIMSRGFSLGVVEEWMDSLTINQGGGG